MNTSKSSKGLDFALLAVASWLIFAPYLFHYYREFYVAAENALIIGSIIGVLAILDFDLPKMWEEGVNFILGIWLMASPMILGFEASNLVVLNTVVPGLLVAVLSIWEMVLQYTAHKREALPHGHGIA